jgi:nondiscriminating glutamyl-tRNA synthetase
MIYDGLGFKLPEFGHISMILGADKQKLSKRNGDSSVHEYLDQGYFVDALMNFLVLLGWSPKGEYKTKSGHPELFSMEEMIELFSLEGLQKSPAVFDVQKLRWMNAQYMRSKSLDEVYKLAKPFFKDSKYLAKGEETLKQMIDIIRGECTLLSDLPKAIDAHFLGMPTLEEEAKKIYQDGANQAVILMTLEEMKAAPEQITPEWIDGLQKSIGAKTGAKGKGLFMTFRVVTSGKVHGPELKKVLPIIGKSELLKRIDQIRSQL